MKRVFAHVQRPVLAALLVATTIVIASTVTAQPLWIVNENASTATLEYLTPDFERDDVADKGSVWFFGGKFRTNDNVSWVVEIPYSRFSSDGFIDGSGFGNVYVGFEARDPGSSSFWEIGARLPTAELEAVFGALTEVVDRLDAFARDALPVNLSINYQSQQRRGPLTRLRAGVSAWIPVGDRNQSELLAHYSAQLGYIGYGGRILAGASGRWIVTTNGGFADTLG